MGRNVIIVIVILVESNGWQADPQGELVCNEKKNGFKSVLAGGIRPVLVSGRGAVSELVASEEA